MWPGVDRGRHTQTHTHTYTRAHTQNAKVNSETIYFFRRCHRLFPKYTASPARPPPPLAVPPLAFACVTLCALIRTPEPIAFDTQGLSPRRDASSNPSRGRAHPFQLWQLDTQFGLNPRPPTDPLPATARSWLS